MSKTLFSGATSLKKSASTPRTMQKSVMPKLEEFVHLPRFPDGRINYTGAKKAPVLNCVVQYGDKVLLLKRSDKVANYQGYWNFVAGFIDEPRPIREKVLEEVAEELKIEEADIASIKTAEPYEVFDPNAQKTWIVYPALVVLAKQPEKDSDKELQKWLKEQHDKGIDLV